MVSIESIERGAARYIDAEILPAIKADGVKGFAVGTAASLLVKRGGNLLRAYASHPLLRQMGIVTADGAVDLDALREAVLENIPQGGLLVALPMGITMRINATDVEALYKTIREEARI